MREYMVEIKAINAAETIAKVLKDEVFTRTVYNKLRKEHHLPAIEFARNHGIIKVVEVEHFEIERNGEKIQAKRYTYKLDEDKYNEIMTFLQTRSGLRKRLAECATYMAKNTAKMKLLAERNAELEKFIELMGEW